jgi:hypothetical protein
MFVRYFLDLEDPFEEVEAALLADPASWVPGMARAAGELGDRLLAEVGLAVSEELRIDQEIEISIGQSYRAPEKTRLPMSWKAAGAGRLFSSLDADVELAGMGASRTQISISAWYHPPMAPFARSLDRALLNRVAEATIKHFLDRVGAALAVRVRARADR